MASIDIRHSKDGGYNWSKWRTIDAGDTGSYLKNLETYGFGIGRQFVFDVRITDRVKSDIIAASIKAEQTDS